MNITEKIVEWLVKLKDRIPKLSSHSTAMRYISWYAVFLILCAMLYLCMLLLDWYNNGRPNLIEMGRFFDRMTSSSIVAAVGFCAKYLVDRDANGVPDEWEKGDENNDRR